ncbi:MAG: alpha-E domain-containing protein, partial [Tepidisphaeraceae bacterium]
EEADPNLATPLTESSVATRVAQHMTFNADNPNSIAACVGRARENARGVRETISAEMWENLNTLYWQVRDAPARFDEAPDDFYRMVMNASMLFQGLSDQTLEHDQRWHFTQLGKYLERIDVTARVIGTRFALLKSVEKQLETPIRNIHWMSVLRSCCSIEAFRRNFIGDLDPVRAATFLLLEGDFPRSVRFCVTQAHAAIAAIRAEVNPRGIDPAERALGRLKIQLEYAEAAEITRPGVPQYCDKIQSDVAEAALAIQKTYFLH